MNQPPRTKGQAGSIDIFVGKRLTQLRKGLGYSQEALANALGITFQQVQKYEKGTNRIAASRLYEFSKILKVRLDDFFSGYEIQPENKTNQFIDVIQSELLEVITAFNKILNKEDRLAAAKNMLLVTEIFKEK